MDAGLRDLFAFPAVTRAGGFREGARASGVSPSRLGGTCGASKHGSACACSTAPPAAFRRPRSARVWPNGCSPRWAKCKPRSTSSTTPAPARPVRSSSTCPATVARLVLPPIVAPFLKTCADIRLEVVVVDRFVDLLAAGCDAGIRYDEWLEEHMIAVPTGPRFQRIATAAAPAYLEAHGRPQHPRDLPGQACLRGQLASGAIPTREFERDGEIVRVDPGGPLLVRLGAAMDLAMDTAVEGPGLIHLFEAWLQPHLDSGALEPGLEPWSPRFTGPYLHYPGCRHLPAPLRAFVDFVEAAGGA